MVSHVRVRGTVGATRQGQQRLWSGKELLQIITPHSMDGSPLRGDYDANEMWEARGALMVNHVCVRGNVGGDPPGSTSVMVGRRILANHYI